MDEKKEKPVFQEPKKVMMSKNGLTRWVNSADIKSREAQGWRKV